MIRARGLVQTFHTGRGKEKKPVHAVAGVDLDVAEGEVVGFLGPNGAGKTTTLRMLTTLLKPTAGTATVAGYDVATEPVQVRRSIGYCSQVGSTFSGAYAGDEVVDHGMLYGMSRAEAVAKGQELFERLQLDGLWRRMPKNMSGGQKRRLDIVMGLIHSPSLVFLDEPTTGLDPQARANLWEHIADLRTAQGATVFLTTHYLDEADALADRIVIIDKGRIVASDTSDNLKAQVAGDLVDLEVSAEAEVAVARDKLASIAPDVVVEGRHVRGRVARAGRAVPGLLRDLGAAGVTLDSIEVARPTLDDVFLTLTGRSLRDAEAAAEADGDEPDGDPAGGDPETPVVAQPAPTTPAASGPTTGAA
ncbi:ATP-binding cassette domain-containing protein [Nocardioides sp. SYSU DS0663]|uniref:ATP-binding cassette domain-containing protein n=1 Tax=Nocardioides sp. SYSU DS0663 TaxID=3416445 RepID=UPI003F4B0AB0